MTSTDEPLVAGISAFALFEILAKMKQRPVKNGMVDIRLDLNREDNAIFLRALLRIDADLRADERLGLAPEHSRRTAAQRRYDALQLLIEQTVSAVKEYNSTHSTS